MHEIFKWPNFTRFLPENTLIFMILPEKLTKSPNVTRFFARNARILHNNCLQNIFSRFFWGARAPCPHLLRLRPQVPSSFPFLCRLELPLPNSCPDDLMVLNGFSWRCANASPLHINTDQIYFTNCTAKSWNTFLLSSPRLLTVYRLTVKQVFMAHKRSRPTHPYCTL